MASRDHFDILRIVLDFGRLIKTTVMERDDTIFLPVPGYRVIISIQLIWCRERKVPWPLGQWSGRRRPWVLQHHLPRCFLKFHEITSLKLKELYNSLPEVITIGNTNGIWVIKISAFTANQLSLGNGENEYQKQSLKSNTIFRTHKWSALYTKYRKFVFYTATLSILTDTIRPS